MGNNTDIKYIQNLIKNLIAKNLYARSFDRDLKPSQEEFVMHVYQDLLSDDVYEMNPGTLGKIMCAFEIGQVLTTRQEIFNYLRFSGDCEDFLRSQVALFLALMIRDQYYPAP